jgi:hypothetical protein
MTHFDLLCPILSERAQFGNLRVHVLSRDYATISSLVPGQILLTGSIELLTRGPLLDLVDRPLEAWWAGWPFNLYIKSIDVTGHDLEYRYGAEFALLYRENRPKPRRLRVGYFGRPA